MWDSSVPFFNPTNTTGKYHCTQNGIQWKQYKEEQSAEDNEAKEGISFVY
jgi:hypothetical protein